MILVIRDYWIPVQGLNMLEAEEYIEAVKRTCENKTKENFQNVEVISHFFPSREVPEVYVRTIVIDKDGVAQSFFDRVP